MKRLIAFTLVLLFILPSMAFAADEQPIKVYIDGIEISFQEKPYMQQGSTVVPFRPIFEGLGLKVAWDDSTQTVTGTKEGLVIKLVLGQKKATVNGKQIDLPIAPSMINGTTFIPLRFVGEASGKDVKWYEDTKSIQIGKQLDLDKLYPIEVNKKQGFMDKTGKIVVKPKYDMVYDFYEGRARVVLNKLYGYIDSTGKEIIPPTYYGAWDFKNGHATVSEKFGSNNLIDLKGHVVPFDQVGAFSDGVAPVSTNDKWGYINTNGKIVIEQKYIEAYPFADGLAKVAVRDSNGHTNYGYIDITGKLVIKAKYGMAKDFSEGYAAVKDQTGDPNSGWGFIDKKGIEFVPLKLTSADPFSEGLAQIVDDNGGGYINSSGEVVIRSKYVYRQYDQSFNNGYAIIHDLVSNVDGVIDVKGNIIVQPKYSEIGNFSDSMAQVKVGGKTGYINEKYEEVIPASDINSGNFHNDLAWIQKSEGANSFGYIDKSGKVVIESKYTKVNDFSDDGIAYVTEDNYDGTSKVGYINKSGKYVWSTTIKN
jgi:hypothetical protein